MKFSKPKCPYCNKKISLFTVWLFKQKGEYTCSRCKNKAVVVHDIKLPFIAAATIFTAVLIYILLRVVIQISVWKILFFILPPYIIFNIISVFFIKLKIPAKRKPPVK